jgi:transcriptional regulator with XRE-family HTH domain
MVNTVSPLRRLRRARTLKQGDMARLLECSHALYCHYESGKMTPPFAMREHIAAILGSSSAELWPELAEQEARTE